MNSNRKWIKRIGAAAVLLLVSQFACSIFGGETIYEDPTHVNFDAVETAPPATQAPMEEPGKLTTPSGPLPSQTDYFEQNGIRLYYDPQLVLDVDPPAESIPASSGDGMYDVAHPAYVHFDLAMEQAQVYIARVQEYEAAADFAPGIIADLQRLNDSINNFSDCVPELPLNEFFRVCDHQQFNSNLKHLDFENGSGTRFVTVYGIQDMAPVDNEHLTYVFQGLTNDGKYYVKAIARVAHVQLPENGEIPSEVYAATDFSVVERYFGSIEQQLNQGESDFSPTLGWIDAFLKSLRVE